MIKHLNFEEEKAKCLAKSSKVIYDKSAFIGNNYKEDYVDVYDTGNGFVFIQTASSPRFDPSTRYDDWTSEKHLDDYGYGNEKIKHGRSHWRRGKPVYK